MGMLCFHLVLSSFPKYSPRDAVFLFKFLAYPISELTSLLNNIFHGRVQYLQVEQEDQEIQVNQKQ